MTFMRVTQTRLSLVFALILTLTACGGIGSTVVSRCPAIVPISPTCAQEWQFDRSLYPDTPTPLEALQGRYADALGLLEDADAALQECRARDKVWLESWGACE